LRVVVVSCCFGFGIPKTRATSTFDGFAIRPALLVWKLGALFEAQDDGLRVGAG
jgi:hypothetical protein